MQKKKEHEDTHGRLSVFHRFDDVGDVTDLNDVRGEDYNKTHGTSVRLADAGTFAEVVWFMRSQGVGGRRMLADWDVLTVYPYAVAGGAVSYLVSVGRTREELRRLFGSRVDTHECGNGIYALRLPSPVLTEVEECFLETTPT